MSAYSTVVVGTDGSDSSYRAVDRAGAIAGAAGAKLIVATAYFPENNPQSADVLKDDAYKVTGKAPVYDILRTARERAAAVGATSVEERSIEGAPVDALLQLVVDSKADLLVVGNVGLNTIAGRLLGSVPSDVARRSKCDVLIVHTT